MSGEYFTDHQECGKSDSSLNNSNSRSVRNIIGPFVQLHGGRLLAVVTPEGNSRNKKKIIFLIFQQ